MPTSRKRGGKKNHQKKVNRRNEMILGERKKIQKKYNQMFENYLSELQNNISGKTENNINVNLDGQNLPFEIVDTQVDSENNV